MKNLHEKRKSKYNIKRAKPREQQAQSMSYDSGFYAPSPHKSGSKNSKKINKMLARLTRQTESSGRKDRNSNSKNELFTKPSNTYQNFNYKPYSASKPLIKKT